jgi:hypothetical protein
MRSHGLPSYPDPQVSESGNHGSIKLSPGRLAGTPAFRAASRACGHLLPGGGAPAAITPQEQAQDLEYARCMRSHGVPSFPDPTFSARGVSLKISAGQGIDPNSPQFQAAQSACQSLQPGGPLATKADSGAAKAG